MARDIVTIVIIITITMIPDFQTDLQKSSIKISITSITNTIIIIDSNLKYVVSNGITIYGKFETIESLTQLFNEYENLFIDQNQIINIPEKE